MCLYRVYETPTSKEYIAANSQQEAVDKYADQTVVTDEVKATLSVEFVGVVYV